MSDADSPALSVVIAWADRAELKRTLAHNSREFAAVGAEVVVANCGGNPGVLAHCIAGSSTTVRSVRIEAPFNKALALNVGAHHASGRVLFFLDADVELQAGTCSAALALLSEHCAVTLDRVRESAAAPDRASSELDSVAYLLELRTRDGRVARVETNRRRLSDGSRSAPGLVFVSKARFEEVGGMNSDLSGWGFEDIDPLVRLQLKTGMRIERSGGGTHLSHGDDRRCIDGESRGRNEAYNSAQCMANYGVGHYLGTYRDDVESWRVGGG